MLPVILGVAAAALFLSGCSREEEHARPASPHKEKPVPKAATPPLAKSVSYAKSCLSGTECTAEQREAGVRDYALAVYASRPEAKFDGLFSVAEKNRSLALWGAPRGDTGLEAYLTKAHNTYLQGHADPNSRIYCAQSSLYHFVRARDESGKTAAALLGPHQCGAQYAELFVKSGVELEIAARQEDWIFFIESSRQQQYWEQQGMKPVEEYALFGRVAEELNIPVVNPLVPLDDPAVAGAMKEHGLSPLEYSVTLAVARINDGFPATPEQVRDLNALSPEEQIKTRLALLQTYFTVPDPRNINTNALAKIFGFPQRDFYVACKSFVTPGPGEDPVAFFQGLKKKLSERADQAIAVSNRLSAQRVREELGKSPKSKALFQMGADHQVILETVYDTAEEIPLKAQ